MVENLEQLLEMDTWTFHSITLPCALRYVSKLYAGVLKLLF